MRATSAGAPAGATTSAGRPWWVRKATSAAALPSIAWRPRLVAEGPSFWSSPLAASTCLVGALLADVAIRATPGSYAVRGLLDEPAHVMTAFLALTAMSALAPQAMSVHARVATLAASTLIDLDHVPQVVFNSWFLTAGTPRPYTHSLATVLVLLALALAARPGRLIRGVCAGAALGVALHLGRDLATGEVALWWPMGGNVHAPYWLYACLLILALVIVTSARAARQTK